MPGFIWEPTIYRYTIYNNASNPTLVSGVLSFNTTSKKWFKNVDASNLPSGNYNVIVTFADSDVGAINSSSYFYLVEYPSWKSTIVSVFNVNYTSVIKPGDNATVRFTSVNLPGTVSTIVSFGTLSYRIDQLASPITQQNKFITGNNLAGWKDESSQSTIFASYNEDHEGFHGPTDVDINLSVKTDGNIRPQDYRIEIGGSIVGSVEFKIILINVLPKSAFTIRNGAADTTPPSVSSVYVAPASLHEGENLSVRAEATDFAGINNISAIIDGIASPLAYNSSSGLFENNTIRAPASGLYTVNITAYDTSGNLGYNNSASITVIDTTPPSITIVSPQNTTYTTSNIALNVTANEAITTWKYSLNGAANVTFTPNITITASQGTNIIIIYANDTTGNWNSSQVSFSVDSVAPDGVSNLQNITYSLYHINWTWSDPTDADFSKVMVYLNGSFKTNVSKGVQFYNATELNLTTTYNISTRTVDNNGNINLTWVNSSAKTAPDLTPPAIQNLKISNITNTSASINWTTNESSLSMIKYGNTSGSYPLNHTSGSNFSTVHRYDLRSLMPATKYYFVANSTDASGNSAQTVEYNFTTASSYIERIVTTINNKTQVASGSGNTTLNITTNRSVSNVPINITEHAANPVSSNNIIRSGTVVSAPSLNKFIEIEASSELKANLSVITIRINYSGSDLSGIDESSLRLHWWNESTAVWDILTDSGVDTANKIVWGNVTHLSLFGVFGNSISTSTPTQTQVSGLSGGGGGGGGVLTL